MSVIHPVNHSKKLLLQAFDIVKLTTDVVRKVTYGSSDFEIAEDIDKIIHKAERMRQVLPKNPPPPAWRR